MKRIFAPPADPFAQAWSSPTDASPHDGFVFSDADTTPDQTQSGPLTASSHFSDNNSHAGSMPPLPADDDVFKFRSTFDEHDHGQPITADEDAETSTPSGPAGGESFSYSAVEPHGAANDATPLPSNDSHASPEFAGLTPFQFAASPASHASPHQACNGPGGQPAHHPVLINGENEMVTAPSGAGGGGAPGGGGSTPVTGGTTASPFVINITYDSTVNSAPAGFITAVNAAVQYLESQFTDAVTININVGYGEVGGYTLDPGALGESLTYLNSYSYTQVRAALIGDASSADDTSATATLPTTSPVSGTYWVSTANAKALGLSGASANVDGYVGFATGNLFDYDSSNGIASNQYDFVGVFAHEVTEVMGRMLLVGGSIGSSSRGYYPLDLFHYSGSGVRDFVGTQAGYFSPDGGVSNLNNFNTNPGGDFGDWASSAGNDSFNAFGWPGVVNAVTSSDIREMDVIGWNLASGSSSPPPPPPASQPDLTVSGLALSGSTVSYHVNNIDAGVAAASTTGLYLSTDGIITTADTLIATTAADALAGGASDTEIATLVLPGNLMAGTYYLGARADISGQVVESNESNNASNTIQIIVGNSSGNNLVGNANDNVMFGLAGNDTLNGGAGADAMYGGAGNDTYVVDNVGDVVIENPNEGTDKVQSSISYGLTANVENLTLTGSAAISGTGNSLNNTIVGNSGNNVLSGGLGNDLLTGGSGADHFVFNTALNAVTNVDTITDFRHSAGDKIDLDHSVFGALQWSGASAPISPSDFYASATGAAHAATDHILYNTATGALYYDADGTDPGAPVKFAVLTGHPALVASDFLIV
jgi:Ca2+-binding RTX toxin-like protein